MRITRSRRRGALMVIALGMAELAASTPGQAVLPSDVIDAAETLEDPLLSSVGEAAEHVGDGIASYYGAGFAGNRTASGERFDPAALTAAHRTLPLGSRIRVLNKANGRSVVVRINDRGPFHQGRLIDLSLAAAKEIRMVGAGRASVRLERIA